MTAGARRTPRSEQRRATEQLRTLAQPHRFRVHADVEGFPIIPGRCGQIEWFCDGVNCHSCAFPGQFVLAVYTDRPRLFEKLWAVPGVKRHQTGDREMRAVFPPEALEQVAAVIRARHKRTQTSSRSLRNLRPRVTSPPQEPLTSHEKGKRSGPTELSP